MPPKRKVLDKTGEAPKASPPKKHKAAETEQEVVDIEGTNQIKKALKGKQGKSKASEKSQSKLSPIRRSGRSKEIVNYAETQPKAEPKKTVSTSKTNKKNDKKKSAPKKVVDGEEEKTEAKNKKSPSKKVADTEDEKTEANDDELASSIYEFTANTIKGEETPLKKYKGNVCLIVNVASKCGHTKVHYEQLVELYDKYEKKGLRILAFPCNQFGSQEPGDPDKICEFVEKRNVTFDMFEKISVKGKNAHPLYNYLTAQKDGPKGRDIEWNFVKFLVDKEGNFVDRYKPGIKPLQMIDDIEKLL